MLHTEINAHTSAYFDFVIHNSLSYVLTILNIQVHAGINYHHVNELINITFITNDGNSLHTHEN